MDKLRLNNMGCLGFDTVSDWVRVELILFIGISYFLFNRVEVSTRKRYVSPEFTK